MDTPGKRVYAKSVSRVRISVTPQASHGSKTYFFGEMAEWSIAAVLKTVEGHTSGGSNPSLSAFNTDFQCFGK